MENNEIDISENENNGQYHHGIKIESKTKLILNKIMKPSLAQIMNE